MRNYENLMFRTSLPECQNFTSCLFYSKPGIISNLRLFCLLSRRTVVSTGMVGRLLRYFLSNSTKMYTIRLTIQVRKSCFIQNRTLRGGWNILIGIFFRFRTLPAGILDADQDFIGDSAHFPYSIHENHGQTVCPPHRYRQCSLPLAAPWYYNRDLYTIFGRISERPPTRRPPTRPRFYEDLTIP